MPNVTKITNRWNDLSRKPLVASTGNLLRKVQQTIYPPRVNLGSTERYVSAAAGGLLLLVGLRSRHRALAWGSRVLGSLLLERAITGRCSVYHALNISRA
jgi:uncharacterized membrane protein